MKIKMYTKLKKREIKVNPFILMTVPFVKPKIPCRIFWKVNKPNLYQPSEIIVEVVEPVEPVAQLVVEGPVAVV